MGRYGSKKIRHSPLTSEKLKYKHSRWVRWQTTMTFKTTMQFLENALQSVTLSGGDWSQFLSQKSQKLRNIWFVGLFCFVCLFQIKNSWLPCRSGLKEESITFLIRAENCIPSSKYSRQQENQVNKNSLLKLRCFSKDWRHQDSSHRKWLGIFESVVLSQPSQTHRFIVKSNQ